MTPLSVRLLRLASLFAVPMGVVILAWASGQGVGLRDLLGVPATASALVEEEGRQVHLNQYIERIHVRRADRAKVTEAVIAGRLSLLEAAACFHDLDRDHPPVVHELRRERYGTASDEEFACVAVIQAVEDRLESEDTRGRDLLPRLREELAHLRRRGPLSLPPPRRLE